VNNEDLDIDNFNVPTLSTDDPIKRIRDNSKNLTSAIQAAQTTVRTMRHRHMSHNYDKDRIEREMKSIHQRVVEAYHHYVAPEIRVRFWLAVVFCVVVLFVGVSGVGS